MRALDKKRENASSVFLPRAFACPSVPAGVCAHADWPVDKLSGLEEWREMRNECVRAGVHT